MTNAINEILTYLVNHDHAEIEVTRDGTTFTSLTTGEILAQKRNDDYTYLDLELVRLVNHIL